MNETLQCVEPTQVLDEDYLIPEASARPEFAQHLKHCQFCRQELATYQGWDTQLHRQFAFLGSPARVLCPESVKLGEYTLNLLGQVERIGLERHLASCEYCPTELASLQTFLTEDDPALDLQPAPSSGFLAGLRRVIATLIQGGTPNTLNYALAGVRGTSEGLPQTYQAEEVFVTLTIQAVAPRSRDLMVLGLIQRDNYPLEATAGARVRLSDRGQAFATETVDELGNFIFAQVLAPAQFDLEITLNDKIVMVPGLALN